MGIAKLDEQLQYLCRQANPAQLATTGISTQVAASYSPPSAEVSGPVFTGRIPTTAHGSPSGRVHRVEQSRHQRGCERLSGCPLRVSFALVFSAVAFYLIDAVVASG